MGQRIKDKGKVFRDPVHRLIRIEKDDQFILDLINTPEFQRLRRVRQLGVSSLTYHGAEHSRFVHSLGVFNFAQRIIAAIRRRYGESHAVSAHLKDHARVAKAAALLHDLGHGPFSHMIERAAQSSFDHERMTTGLITREESSVNRVLRDHGIEPKSVADVIDKVFPHRLVVDIVSSQLDADRMDYLLRDSLMTGVEYGVYDAEWVLNSMCVGLDPYSDDGTGAWRLCLDRDRGLFAAEQLILARHHMMLQVYMHRVTRGYEVMLLDLFKAVAQRAKSGVIPAGTPESVASYFRHGIEMPLQDWLLFDESAMVAAMQAWSLSDRDDERPIAERSAAFLKRERLVRGYSLSSLTPTQWVELVNGLRDANLAEGLDWGLDDGKHLPYKGVVHGAAKGDEQSSLSILLSDGDSSTKAVALETVSNVMHNLDNDSQSVARLYVHRERVREAFPLLRRLRIAKGDGE